MYEKYIKKNGKIYGPYTYHSKRVNGKVISEYHGQKRGFNYRNFILVLGGVFLISLFVIGFLFFNRSFVGKIILDISPDYQEGQILEGTMRFSLKEGELIPASSKVVIQTGEQRYEYSLQDLISEEITEGNFYAEGTSISGSGSGYGVKGNGQIYPNLFFTLELLTESVSDTKQDNGEKESSEISEPVEEITEEVTVEEEPVEEEPVEEITEEITVEEEPVEEITEEVTVAEETEKSESEVDTTITGEIIGGFLNFASNIFQTFTGQVSLQIIQEIDGKTSFGDVFTYNLGEGETVEIKKDSVYIFIDGNYEKIDESDIDLRIEDNKAIVTTDYSIEKLGFGENYLGDVAKTLEIDLSSFNIIPTKENLKVSLVYDEIEIISVSGSLEGEVISSDVEEDITTNVSDTFVENITEDIEFVNETMGENMTFVENITEVFIEILTFEEKQVLIDKYGDVLVEITKAEQIRDRIVVIFELGDYSIEHSYDRSLSDKELEIWIERDKIRLLKDVANELSKEKVTSIEIEGIVGSYGV